MRISRSPTPTGRRSPLLGCRKDVLRAAVAAQPRRSDRESAELGVKTRDFGPIRWRAFVRRPRGQMLASRAVLAIGQPRRRSRRTCPIRPAWNGSARLRHLTCQYPPGVYKRDEKVYESHSGGLSRLDRPLVMSGWSAGKRRDGEIGRSDDVEWDAARSVPESSNVGAVRIV